MLMEARCYQKKIEYQIYPQQDFCTARYEHKSSQKKFQTYKKKRKKNAGQMLGQDRPGKNSAKK